MLKNACGGIPRRNTRRPSFPSSRALVNGEGGVMQDAWCMNGKPSMNKRQSADFSIVVPAKLHQNTGRKSGDRFASVRINTLQRGELLRAKIETRSRCLEQSEQKTDNMEGLTRVYHHRCWDKVNEIHVAWRVDFNLRLRSA